MDTQDSSQTLDEKDSASSSFSAESRSLPHPSSNAPEPQSSTASYLAYPVAHVVSGLYRRLTEPSIPPSNPPLMRNMHYRSQDDTSGIGNVYTPPGRTASPFQPPPLTPLTLRGIHSSTPLSAQILTRSLGEEIRLLVPPRLQLVADWTLVYSVEQDGTSLGTLYKKCEEFSGGNNNGFVLVVRDSVGGVNIPLSHPLDLADFCLLTRLTLSLSLFLDLDFRRLSHRPSTPVLPLLRNGRMLPLARFGPAHVLDPRVAASAPERRYHESATQHDHRFTAQDSVLQDQERPRTKLGNQHAGADTLQSLSLQWGE